MTQKAKTLFSLSVVILGLAANISYYHEKPATKSTTDQAAQVDPDFGKVELVFEPNVGQTDDEVKFLNRAGSTTTYFTPTETVMVNSVDISKADENVILSEEKTMSTSEVDMDTEPELVSDVLRMSLVDANSNPEITGENEVESKSNYFIGNDSSKWQSDITNYQKVKYSQVYDGIDLVYYGNNKQMEHDFIVAPYTDYTKIAFNLDGAKELYINDDGDLVAKQDYTDTIFKKPFTYQVSSSSLSRKSDNDSDIEDPDRFSISDSVRVKNDKGESRLGMTNDSNIAEIESSYVLDGNTIKFALSDYDPAKPVVIDPAVYYSTYLGGTGSDTAYEVAASVDGTAVVCGITSSSDFPTASPYQGSYAGGGRDIIVSKFSFDGSSLDFSTYLGGGGFEDCFNLVIDGPGNIYFTGRASSSDYPVSSGAYQTTRQGGTRDAIATKLSSDGSSLIYSTYVGANGSTNGSGIAVDDFGNAYLTGTTLATNFATAGTYQDTKPGGDDGYIAKLNSTGTAMLWASYVGGTGIDGIDSVSVDSSGNGYFVGQTTSTDMPTSSPYQAANAGSTDAVFGKISSDGTSMSFLSYLGGTGDDDGSRIDIDDSGNLYLTGWTSSTDYPTTSPYQSSNAGGANDVFITKVNSSGASLSYSTYLGGTGNDRASDITLRSGGSVVVSVITDSTDYPVASPYQASYGGGTFDAALSELSSTGGNLLYSTYFGGSGSDVGYDIAAVTESSIYIAGQTDSSDFPVALAYQGSNAGSADAFLVKLLPSVIISATVDPTLTMSLLCSGGACTSSNNIPESGSLSSGAINTNDNITFQVASNATNGYVVGYNATQTLTSGSNTISVITGGSGSSPGSEQYGFNLKLNTGPFGAEPTPDTATACQANTITANYGTANAFDYDLKTAGSYQNLVTTTGPTEPCTFTVSHMVNIDTTTQAGEYTNTEIYRVVASY